ncbi:GDSL-type esterase/lipase family protein [Candidatus Omnitrophota bacterium]
MKRNSLLLTALLGLCMLAAGCTRCPIANIDSKGTQIICFGDSITFGYGALPGEDYPAVLTELVEYPVINAGIDGDTTVEGVKRFKSDVLDRDPLLVIIEFGGNDFLRKIPKQTTLANLEDMIDKSLARGSMVAIVDISAGPLLKEYRFAYRRMAKEKGAIFIPSVLSRIVTNPELKSDFMHPNAGGYKMIAQRIYHFITPHLNQNKINRELPKK